MLKIRCENESGTEIDFSDESKYVITNIDGLNPPASNIVINNIPNTDGGIFRSSKMQTRNLVITFAVKKPVERNRLDAYRVFRSKRYIKTYIQTKALNVFIEGYVESVECNNFTLGQNIQVSIICPDPYFKNVDTLKAYYNTDIDTLEFPIYTMQDNPIAFNDTLNANKDGEFNVFNAGDTETGMEIVIKPKSGYVVFNIMLKNKFTGEYIYISNGISSALDEYITINTRKGEKNITQTTFNPKTGENVTISIVDACIINSWLEVHPFENTFIVSVDIQPEGYVEFEDGINKLIPEQHMPDIEDYLKLRNSATRSSSVEKLELVAEIYEKWQGV